MIKSLEAQGLQLAKEKQEYLGWLEGWFPNGSSTWGPGAIARGLVKDPAGVRVSQVGLWGDRDQVRHLEGFLVQYASFWPA